MKPKFLKEFLQGQANVWLKRNLVKDYGTSGQIP